MAKEHVSKIVAMIEEQLAERAPPDAPALRVIDCDEFPPAFEDAVQRVRWCDRINFLVDIYGIRPWLRTQLRGYYGLESMPDDELEALANLVERGAQYCREGISFEDAGLIEPACDF